MSEDIVHRLRTHVNDRGGASLANGAWSMMLEAATEIEHLRIASSLYADVADLYSFEAAQAIRRRAVSLSNGERG